MQFPGRRSCAIGVPKGTKRDPGDREGLWGGEGLTISRDRCRRGHISRPLNVFARPGLRISAARVARVGGGRLEGERAEKPSRPSGGGGERRGE